MIDSRTTSSTTSRTHIVGVIGNTAYVSSKTQIEGQTAVDRELAAGGTLRKCQWCHGRRDGVYADDMADPPCSYFFRCSQGELAAVDLCRKGLVFSQDDSTCMPASLLPQAGHCWQNFSFSSAPSCDGLPANISHKCSSTCSRRRGLRGESISPAVSNSAPRRMGLENVAAHLDDLNALLALKERNLDLGGEFENWNLATNPDICTWNGITCKEEEPKRVSEINFPADLAPLIAGKPAFGQSLPPALGKLAKLSVLVLARSAYGTKLAGLIGSIPSELGSCTDLVDIGLGGNNLVGELPETLSRLQFLTRLSLVQNGLTGSIPSWLESLPYLKILNFGQNRFSGSIPAQIGQLENLLLVGVDLNRELEGSIPETFRNLRQLEEISLDHTKLSGPFPSFLFGLSSIITMSLSGMNISGPIPLTLVPNMPSLMYLTLGSPGLYGMLPGSFIEGLCKNSPMLTSLGISSTKLTGSLPVELKFCQSLAILELIDNKFTGSFPSVVAEAWSNPSSIIESIILASNQLSGTLPSTLTGIPSLAVIDVSNNNFSGPLPPFNCSANSNNGIAVILVGNNSFEGSIPQGLNTDCKFLDTFDASNNQLSGTIPKGLLRLPSLQFLNLNNNGLTGPLPVPKKCDELREWLMGSNRFEAPFQARAFNNCTLLREIDISNNNIQEPFPHDFGSKSLHQFSFLNASKNSFSGPLPSSLTVLDELNVLDFSLNDFSGALDPHYTLLTNLRTLNLSRNHISSTIPSEYGNFSGIRDIILRENQLSGEIPLELATPRALFALEDFDVSGNNLSGIIPPGFASAVNGTHFNFSNNQLSGQIPGGTISLLPPSAFSNNSGLCGAPGYPECPTSGSSIPVAVIVGASVAGFFVILVLLFLLWLFCFRRADKWAGGRMLVFDNFDFRLNINHILEATEHFNDEKYRLGRGGFGSVYRATLQDGRTVAIKRLALGSDQGEKEFEAECNILGNIKHRHLVRLLAAFIGKGVDGERLLIYNFVQGGSIDGLMGKELPKDHPFLNWSTRRSIIEGVARGMKYLHDESQVRIIHRDMKPANVLIDEHFCPFVADFGLARAIDRKQTHLETSIMGTVGYISPEYARNGTPSLKSDVFAFGVTALQILTCRSPTDDSLEGRGMARWISRSDTSKVLDGQLKFTKEEFREILGVVKISLQCCERTPVDRPTMAEVVYTLDNLGAFVQQEGFLEAFIGTGDNRVKPKMGDTSSVLTAQLSDLLLTPNAGEDLLSKELSQALECLDDESIDEADD